MTNMLNSLTEEQFAEMYDDMIKRDHEREIAMKEYNDRMAINDGRDFWEIMSDGARELMEDKKLMQTLVSVLREENEDDIKDIDEDTKLYNSDSDIDYFWKEIYCLLKDLSKEQLEDVLNYMKKMDKN